MNQTTTRPRTADRTRLIGCPSALVPLAGTFARERAFALRVMASCGRWAFVLLAVIHGCAAHVDHPDVRAVLDRQAAAWNQGNLDGYLAAYWNSDELTFSSNGEETHGYQTLCERYKRGYPNRDAMGELFFDEIEIARKSDEHAEVSGRYHLKRPASPQSGRFYLRMQRLDGGWFIVLDKTVSER